MRLVDVKNFCELRENRFKHKASLRNKYYFSATRDNPPDLKIIDLNFVQRLMRFLFKAYPLTHASSVQSILEQKISTEIVESKKFKDFSAKNSLLQKLRAQKPGFNWHEIPDYQKNQRSIFQIAIQHDGLLLKDAPDSFKGDRDIVSLAVQQNGEALALASLERLPMKDLQHLISLSFKQLAQRKVKEGSATENIQQDLDAFKECMMDKIKQLAQPIAEEWNNKNKKNAGQIDDARQQVLENRLQEIVALQDTCKAARTMVGEVLTASPVTRDAILNLPLNLFSSGAIAQNIGKFLVDLQELERSPIDFAIHFAAAMRTSKEIAINYVDHQSGIGNADDAGGVTRDFITRLFNHLMKVLPKEDNNSNNLCVPKIQTMKGLPPAKQVELFKSIGIIFASALSKTPTPFVIGHHFHPMVFQMICSLSLDDFKTLSAHIGGIKTDVMHENKITSKTIECILTITNKLFKVYFNDCYPNNKLGLLFEENLSLEDRSKLKEELQKFLSDDVEGTEEGIHKAKMALLELSQFDQVLGAVLLLADAMYCHYTECGGKKNSWKNVICGATEAEINCKAEGLQQKIQGILTADSVIKALQWEFDGAYDAAKASKKRKDMGNWLKSAQVDTLKNFVFAISGSETLHPETRLTIEVDRGAQAHFLPTFHTCSKQMNLPDEFSLNKLEDVLKQAIAVKNGGFQFA